MLQEALKYLQRWLDWMLIRRDLLLRSGVEILIIFLFLYGFIRLLRGTRGAGILKGLVFFLTVLILGIIGLSRQFELWRLDLVISKLSVFILMPLIILFQPEIRRAFIHIGQNPLMRLFFKSQNPVTDEIVKAAVSMGKDRIGGLVVIARDVGLSAYIEGGVSLDAVVHAETIKTIFWPGTPLHDGAIVIHQRSIAAAGCLLPLTENPEFSAEVGTRHRAGIGITEESDAISIIVSEQTGQISLAVNGKVRWDLDEKDLRRCLRELLAEVHDSSDDRKRARR